MTSNKAIVAESCRGVQVENASSPREPAYPFIISSFFFDFCHGLCTFLVLWALGDPWVRKLERIKIKFGLTAEERNYALPPSTFEIARENYE